MLFLGVFSQRWVKKRVQEILSKNPMVESFRDASPGAGGWGASIVELKKR